MYLKSVLLFFVGLLIRCNGQFAQDGQCDPNISTQLNFNADNFAGQWFEIGTSPNPSRDGECSALSISRVDASSFLFSYESVNRNLKETTNAPATLAAGTARFTVNLGAANGGNADFWILGSNNQDYAIGYNCQNINSTHRNVNIWQFGRTTTINPIFNNIMNGIIAPLGLSVSDLRPVDHSTAACFALPVIAPNQPIVIPGQCSDDMSLLNSFDATQFLGTWHEIYSYYSESALGSCGRAQYSLGQGGLVDVVNSQVVNQALQTFSGTASVVDASKAKLLVTLEVQPNVFDEQELWVIDTDYSNYAISYSCVNVSNNTKRVFSWILGRSRELPPASQIAVNNAVDSILDLNFIYYDETSRSDNDCFYYPEPAADRIVEFRGPCDMNIPAVPNFNPELYQGLWHDIASYPSGFQQGSCNEARYTLVNGVVDVLNTEVINQALDTMIGTAVLASTDGTAKLEVTFPIAGVPNATITTNYWVLATDYVSHSLVYTCEYNQATDTRRVWSWKLSRSKTLSAASNTAINAVMANIPVLDDRYHIQRDHSPEGCFYFPEAEPGKRVVFPGQCEQNLPAVANFDLSLFQGTWHETDTYPKDESGDCVKHDYTLGTNNALNLISSFNIDQFLQTSSSVLTRAANDNSGRFTISINVGQNQVIDIPFWILLIDNNYNNYALAYSCMNLDVYSRAVYFWKLSRNQQLSQQGQTAINNFINTSPIQILQNRYFEPVDQSTFACASLPEIPAGQPIIVDGQCDANIQVVQNFQPARYVGVWHLIESYPSEFQGGTCNDATYTAQPDGSVLVVNSQVINQRKDTITGVARLATTDSSGKLIVSFPNATDIEYWIIDTDYESYSLVYSCANLPNNNQRVWSWKLSRTRSLSNNANDLITGAMRDVRVLNDRYFYTINNSPEACFYFPYPDGNAVVFRGQCDESLPVVTNFNAVGYMGSWNDIESYPQQFQEGTCSTADYSLRDGGVDVFNTQVVNQRLDTINGRAELVPSNDGSAKLTVAFPVAGTNLTTFSPYWVLATDYSNFALVYSCQNIDADHRYVSSWKLSRQKTLSQASQTAINNVIANVNVLSQEYYEVSGHSDEQCFYYPEATGQTVRFRGQCDNSIQAVPNFDLSRFTGVWNEIETYPKEEVGGDCIHHEFTAVTGSTTTLQLTSNQVFNAETLVSNNGQIVRAANENTGRFTLSITTGNQTITFPYWVLETDYTGYALVYSCVNVNAEERAVYSWKLSRSKSLTNAANTAINAKMATINVLDQQYFQLVPQTDAVCFYLPELGPNEAVVLPGQCNRNLPLVQNFNPARYVGLWHLIESYPSEFQSGTCNDATYTAQSDGSVMVFNTQVINQALDTITGVARLASTDGSGKLTVSFPDAPDIEYWIIDTDYESYSLVVSCADVTSSTQRVWSWKLSRTRSLTAAANTAITDSMSRIRELNQRYFYTINNTPNACFYFPVPDGRPVQFRGVCNEDIPVVTNFNVAAYLGKWYDLESYPQEFQDGTCSTAEYSLGLEGVDVFNTQVINQTLDTIVGRAELVPSNDGSAKLTVFFPIAGTNFTAVSPYWVLATDYTNFALVYSCQNVVGSDARNVRSWKLSRQRTLAPASQTAINNVIAYVDVLRQEYYEVQGHSDEQCFYNPVPTGKRVEFRGQCSNNIQAVPNFDLNAFAGSWNEIETYPKEEAGGDCINHEFGVTGTTTTLQLTSNQVFGSENLVSNNGQIVRAANENTGRFTLTMTVGNNTITFPYWILATDYTDYALVYSCVNINSEYRAIYSWKLSRSRSLSNAANNAITSAMQSVDVLQQQYFLQVPQTDAACFYLPDIGLNEEVTFPGQCSNISNVQNFEASRFAGRWFDIESYFDGYQGTCIDGTFMLNGPGYDVLLSQVVNQGLDVTGSRAIIPPGNDGRLLVTNNDGTSSEFLILGTDYTSWSLIYSCQDIGPNRRRVRTWKLSRTRQLTSNSNNAINAIFDSVDVLNQRYLVSRDHSAAGCFYFPIPDGRPVRFRTRCDQTIPVVQNFNAGNYLGTWHDIESYPQQFQDGECATAVYSQGNNVVDVYNTQVVNQTLDVMNGTAVVSSNDGSAKLDVTFVVSGVTVTTPYWVLATDYTSYSLVYSCSEIDDEYSSVTAWKLSRTRALTPAANTAINNAMNNIPVLQQAYFVPVGHSEEDCFFYPNNNGGPVILDGQCPQSNQIDAVTNFNIYAFANTWHEISRFPSELQDGECASIQYTADFANLENDTLSLTHNIVFNETLVSVSGSGSVTNDGRGVITANFGFGANARTLNTYILDTDYAGFALVYSCRNIDSNSKQIYSWILSRSRMGITQAAQERINNIVSTNEDLFALYYEPTRQDNDACFYYPDLDPTEGPIELPGFCPIHIRGIPNFNAAAYLGRWFEMSKYPQPSQFGQCNRAEYSSGDAGSVDVFNTQVENRTLFTQSGNAVVASNDGTAQLNVTFVVNGVTNTADYFVLGTDYTNYALVYSCRNLTNGNRQVFSWILSRQRTISTVSMQAVNNIINDVQGLRPRFYLSTSQSDEDCFYLPEPNPDESVVVRGSCGNIVGMQNFDIQRYLGIWHNVERYPTGQDQGVCTRATFSTSTGNTIQVADQTVFGLTAQINVSTVTASNDGRIVINFVQGNHEIDSEYWVLDTDYTSYALLYFCTNINDEYRRVSAAKHSRSRSLTTAAQNALDQAITVHPVLDQRYFTNVDQSDAACFHYPEATGQPTVLPGQCDNNIPVVQNFSAAEYTGTWYQIERYPQRYESGNCTGARYTLNEETEVVTVLNWEVIDGKLDEIEGNATIISTDGGAKLLVTLPSRAVEGELVTMELFVLTTDYVSYSLAYSCVNIDQYYRQLGVWKLSRTRTMPAAGITSINSYMAQRQELDQRYFVPVSQSEECLEPSSGYLVQSSIIVLLVCIVMQLFK